MTAPEKITASGEAPGFKADYQSVLPFFIPPNNPKKIDNLPIPD
jgi:hypothetical protein